MPILLWEHIDTFLSRLMSVQRCYNQSGDGAIYSLTVYDYLYLTEVQTFSLKTADSVAGVKW